VVAVQCTLRSLVGGLNRSSGQTIFGGFCVFGAGNILSYWLASVRSQYGEGEAGVQQASEGLLAWWLLLLLL
jgi:hypothetical protein